MWRNHTTILLHFPVKVTGTLSANLREEHQSLIRNQTSRWFTWTGESAGGQRQEDVDGKLLHGWCSSVLCGRRSVSPPLHRPSSTGSSVTQQWDHSASCLWQKQMTPPVIESDSLQVLMLHCRVFLSCRETRGKAILSQMHHWKSR